MAGAVTPERIGPGVFHVQVDGKAELVYVAGEPGDWWAFWNGRIFRGTFDDRPTPVRPAQSDARQALSAPMPSTVLKVLVSPGAVVRKGETVLILEAMKMELPLRSAADATVTAVNCREGQLVQPDMILVELAAP